MPGGRTICASCGKPFRAGAVGNAPSPKLCGREDCYAKAVAAYWARQGFLADVQIIGGFARLVKISTMDLARRDGSRMVHGKAIGPVPVSCVRG